MTFWGIRPHFSKLLYGGFFIWTDRKAPAAGPCVLDGIHIWRLSGPVHSLNSMFLKVGRHNTWRVCRRIIVHQDKFLTNCIHVKNHKRCQDLILLALTINWSGYHHVETSSTIEWNARPNKKAYAHRDNRVKIKIRLWQYVTVPVSSVTGCPLGSGVFIGIIESIMEWLSRNSKKLRFGTVCWGL